MLTKFNCVLIFFGLCRTLCGLILFLCLVGSIVDILLSFTKPHSTPVNKSDGFMPIRKVSIATDHDEAPCLPFGNDNPNNAHAIHPSPEVNVSGNYMITSFQQQTVKPSKCRVWTGQLLYTVTTGSPSSPSEPCGFYIYYNLTKI